MNSIAARLVEPAKWLIVGGLAFTLANSVLFFVSGGQSGALPGTPVSRTSSVPDTSEGVSINAIVSRNLFGEAGATGDLASDNLPAVETRLPLELRGVFVADELENSVAIVAQKGKLGELYNVGDVLPGNATLVEVHPDHIILRRAGSRETLRFPDPGEAQLIADGGPGRPGRNPIASNTSRRYSTRQRSDAATGTDAARQSQQSAATPREFVDAYRERLNEDPQGALNELGITPVSEGSAEGYRLDSVAANSPYLSQTGLQPGDIILSVNDQPLGNVRQDQQQIDNILAQGSARLEVQRGTRRFFVTASLK